ncbi:MAG: hypothetical protein KF734_02675 [Saprospiraceae bacterium]|nr:hypothetical protein [Saprospiraceae bacterium]
MRNPGSKKESFCSFLELGIFGVVEHGSASLPIVACICKGANRNKILPKEAGQLFTFQLRAYV